jgi:hypothetical protein
VARIQEPLLETTVDVAPSGLRLSVRGQLSASTVPALRSLIEAFHDTRERVVQLDLRAAERSPAVDGVLERWGLTAAEIAGVYFVPSL